MLLSVSAGAKEKSSAKIQQAREAEPYLVRFKNDWATGEIICQFINSRWQYEVAKANGKTGRMKQKRVSKKPAMANKRVKQFASEDIDMQRTSDNSSSNTDDDVNGEDDITGREDSDAGSKDNNISGRGEAVEGDDDDDNYDAASWTGFYNHSMETNDPGDMEMWSGDDVDG